MRQTPLGPQLLATGDTLRFCVGSCSEPRSNVWSVIGGRRTDEVYLAARNVMGSAKLSMHSSGRWRWAMTSEEATRRQLDAEQDRVILRWEQPAPVAPGLDASSDHLRPLFKLPLTRTGEVAQERCY